MPTGQWLDSGRVGVIQEWEARPCHTLVQRWSVTGASLLGALAWLSGQEADPLAWGARALPIPPCPLLPRVESAGFPQPTMADFRMTLPEAEVNQPSQPPLSIFSLGEGKTTSFIFISFTQRPTPILVLGSHAGFGLLPQPEAFRF